MTEESPFSAKRYEHAGRHVYFIPPEAFRLLELPIPTYLVGTRGTGKTTLLRALSWDERLYNGSLHSQLGSETFANRYIGLYFKLPNVQLDLLDRWLKDESDADYAALIAFYLDLCWLETAGTALKHLTAQRVVCVDGQAEEELVAALREVWRSFPALDELIGPSGDSVAEILAFMHPMRRLVERFARHRADVPTVLDGVPAGQVGSFGRNVGALLASAFRSEEDGGRANGWTFRICMDEGEVLTLRQQRVINTMVRLTESPVFYLVAYVSRPQDATGTYLSNQTLQHADRQILVRDDMTDKEFRQLAEGVVNVRLEAMLGRKATIRSTRLLGKLDINDLLRRALRESVNPHALALLNDAAVRGGRGAPPIYETYLEQKRPELAAQSSQPLSTTERRRHTSATIRKQMVAAYLSICREMRVDPLYASADMVFQISDKCVRDYLWQMESIYSEAGLPLGGFLDAHVAADVQSIALAQAATLKMTLFRERVLSAPAEATQVVEGLARVTANIQSTGRNYEQLRTPERGIFTHREVGEEGRRWGRLLRDAAEAGFLKLFDEGDSDEIRFRVHASLAPRYGFSYRGAYYAAGVLQDQELSALATATTQAALQRAVSTIANRITGRRGRQSRGDQDQLRFDESEEQ